MNTGIQSSDSTPLSAWTTTTPGGKPVYRKDMVGIVAAHKIPYTATASVGYVKDFRKKGREGPGRNRRRARLHPCPRAVSDRVGQQAGAVDRGRQVGGPESLPAPLRDRRRREYKMTLRVANPKPVVDYLRIQKRFAGVDEKKIDELQAAVEKEYAHLMKKMSQ